MPEGDILYDAGGNPIGTVGRSNGAGMFVLPTEPASAAPARPVVTPGGSQSDAPPQHVATTQVVQGLAEYTEPGEVVGGATFVPFGPVITIETDEAGAEVDPGYTWTWTPQGARRTFRIAESVGLMPLLRFAHAAKQGLDSEDLEGMAALYDMISDCVEPEDWQDFQKYAVATKAEDDDLMEFVSAAMEIITARPRKPRGSSSAISQRTSARSKGGSSRPASAIPAGAIRPPEIDGLMPVADLVK